MNAKQAGAAAGAVAGTAFVQLLKLLERHDALKFPIPKQCLVEMSEVLFSAVEQATVIGCLVDDSEREQRSVDFSRN